MPKYVMQMQTVMFRAFFALSVSCVRTMAYHEISISLVLVRCRYWWRKFIAEFCGT